LRATGLRAIDLHEIARPKHRPLDLCPLVSLGKPGEPSSAGDAGDDVAPVQPRDAAIVAEDVPHILVALTGRSHDPAPTSSTGATSASLKCSRSKEAMMPFSLESA
jgi:hypothetical protein